MQGLLCPPGSLECERPRLHTAHVQPNYVHSTCPYLSPEGLEPGASPLDCTPAWPKHVHSTCPHLSLKNLGPGASPLDCTPAWPQVRRVAARRRDTVCISGLTGDGMEELLDMLADKMAQSMVEVGGDGRRGC